MNQDFETLYYESEDFWGEDFLKNSKELNRIKETVKFLPNNATNILDVGCGNGAFCNYLHVNRPEIRIIGLDRSETALKYVATEKMLGEITAIPFEDGSFECVACLQVLEHIKFSDYKKALQELARVSNKYILVSVPYREKIEQNTTQCPSCKSIFNYDLHLRSYDDETISRLFSDLGFELIKSKNIGSYQTSKVYSFYLRLRNRYNKKENDLKSKFNSPLCPICGFKNPERVVKHLEPDLEHGSPSENSVNNSNNNNLFRKILRTVWLTFKPYIPVETHCGYWIVALYQKKN